MEHPTFQDLAQLDLVFAGEDSMTVMTPRVAAAFEYEDLINAGNGMSQFITANDGPVTLNVYDHTEVVVTAIPGLPGSVIMATADEANDHIAHPHKAKQFVSDAMDHVGTLA